MNKYVKKLKTVTHSYNNDYSGIHIPGSPDVSDQEILDAVVDIMQAHPDERLLKYILADEATEKKNFKREKSEKWLWWVKQSAEGHYRMPGPSTTGPEFLETWDIDYIYTLLVYTVPKDTPAIETERMTG